MLDRPLSILERRNWRLQPGGAATDMAGAAHSGSENEIPREIIMAAKRPDFPRLLAAGQSPYVI
jgi:hypothetical protein